VAVAGLIYCYKQKQEHANNINQLKNRITNLEIQAKTSERNYQDTLLNNCDLLKTISDLRIELAKYEGSDEVELTRINTLINERLDKLNALDESIKVSSDKLVLLENDYTARQNELAAQLQSSNDSRATLLEEQNRLQESILTAQKEVDALHDQKVAVENELVTLRNELGQLAIRSRTALLENWKDVGELGIK
jgi:chromosome segregation ATPase